MSSSEFEVESVTSEPCYTDYVERLRVKPSTLPEIQHVVRPGEQGESGRGSAEFQSRLERITGLSSQSTERKVRHSFEPQSRSRALRMMKGELPLEETLRKDVKVDVSDARMDQSITSKEESEKEIEYDVLVHKDDASLSQWDEEAQAKAKEPFVLQWLEAGEASKQASNPKEISLSHEELQEKESSRAKAVKPMKEIFFGDEAKTVPVQKLEQRAVSVENILEKNLESECLESEDQFLAQRIRKWQEDVQWDEAAQVKVKEPFVLQWLETGQASKQVSTRKEISPSREKPADKESTRPKVVKSKEEQFLADDGLQHESKKAPVQELEKRSRSVENVLEKNLEGDHFESEDQFLAQRIRKWQQDVHVDQAESVVPRKSEKKGSYFQESLGKVQNEEAAALKAQRESSFTKTSRSSLKEKRSRERSGESELHLSRERINELKSESDPVSEKEALTQRIMKWQQDVLTVQEQAGTQLDPDWAGVTESPLERAAYKDVEVEEMNRRSPQRTAKERFFSDVSSQSYVTDRSKAHKQILSEADSEKLRTESDYFVSEEEALAKRIKKWQQDVPIEQEESVELESNWAIAEQVQSSVEAPETRLTSTASPTGKVLSYTKPERLVTDKISPDVTRSIESQKLRNEDVVQQHHGNVKDVRMPRQDPDVIQQQKTLSKQQITSVSPTAEKVSTSVVKPGAPVFVKTLIPEVEVKRDTRAQPIEVTESLKMGAFGIRRAEDEDVPQDNISPVDIEHDRMEATDYPYPTQRSQPQPQQKKPSRLGVAGVPKLEEEEVTFSAVYDYYNPPMDWGRPLSPESEMSIEVGSTVSEEMAEIERFYTPASSTEISQIQKSPESFHTPSETPGGVRSPHDYPFSPVEHKRPSTSSSEDFCSPAKFLHSPDDEGIETTPPVFTIDEGMILPEGRGSLGLGTLQEKVQGIPPAFLKPLTKRRVFEGDSLQFCAEVFGLPTPEVKWFRNKTELEADKRTSIERDGDNIALEIRNITKADQGEYICEALNYVGEAKSVALVVVISQEARQMLPPPAVTHQHVIEFDVEEDEDPSRSPSPQEILLEVELDENEVKEFEKQVKIVTIPEYTADNKISSIVVNFGIQV
ncbi:muscle M-line assembly unc-89-like protein [Labeo rohita]|uniref:Muscle M-line assembly unc-89-like protein n=1 Tax=Labeo rohita TaxID=84645 RepID=A0A498NIC7_LABRO|nr:muscle M-line assembly unc-89-like protein [Labeo rohita]